MVNKEQLIRVLADRAGFTKKKTREFLEAFVDVMSDFMLEGETVKIMGLLKAEVVESKGRIVKLPGTNDLVEVPTQKRVKFTASDTLNAVVKDKNR